MTIEADFTQPNIIYSEKKIYFKYFWERNVPIIPLEKELALTRDLAYLSTSPSNLALLSQ
jgi:hypothetical protein